MFSIPCLKNGEQFPSLPVDDPQFHQFLGDLGMQIDPTCDVLPQITEYAIGWVEEDLSIPHATRSRCHQDAPQYSALAAVGLINAIDPQTTRPDFTVTDGGALPTCEYRLGYIEQQRRSGGLQTPHIGVYGGQRLRIAADGTPTTLEESGKRLLQEVDDWAQEWLTNQLARNPVDDNPWERSFATEHQVAILALLRLYKGRLSHQYTLERSHPQRLDASIPAPTVAAEVFTIDDGTTVMALNAPAIIREHVGRKLPISQARPTGRSCFFEWEALVQPPEGASVLLVTHNPNIYRSWLDLLLSAREIGRQDLHLEGAGPCVESHRTLGYILRGLGDIIMNHYNHTYKGGVNAAQARNNLRPKFT